MEISVVPYIHKAIGSRHLPLSDLVLIHFDSHPDLLISNSLQADDVYNKQTLYDIENWIIPLVYAGHINEVYWIKPPWCDQIKDKVINFYVGKSKKDGFIRTTCKENYFISEVLYLPEEEMTNKQKVTLTTLTVCPRKWSELDDCIIDHKDTKSNPHVCSTDSNIESQSNLSSNSTKIELNCQTFSSSNTKTVSRISEPPLKKSKMVEINEPSLIEKDSENVLDEKFVNYLEEVFEKLKDKNIILDIDLDFFSTKNPFREMYSEKQYKILTYHFRSDIICDLVDDLRKSHDQVDFELLHEAGCTCDDTELPHHVSNQEQITCLVDAVQEVLCHMQKPIMITMARSSNDDYCPPDQVDSIQDKVVDMLKELYLEISVTEDYDI
ncbi:hypothetical protein KUTeg_019653, partial [Tegillarca granosa]